MRAGHIARWLEEGEVVEFEAGAIARNMGIGMKEVVLWGPEVGLQTTSPNCFQYLVPMSVTRNEYLLTIPVHFYFLYPCMNTYIIHYT